MLFTVLFEDNPDLEVDPRAQLIPAHLDFLERQAARIRAARPLAVDSGAAADA